jgi:AcrR family transcriptional regulator
MARRTADERRAHVLDAAIAEFAAQGYHAASTTAIARRAGISQPYVYALYRNKRELFLAAYREVAERIRARLVGAAQPGGHPDGALRTMGEAYLGLIADRDDVLCQLQAYAAAGDPALREPMREEFLRMFESVREAAGVSREEAAFFFAGGIFLAIATALDVPPEYWPGGGANAPPGAPGTPRGAPGGSA